MGYSWECATKDAGFIGRDGAALVSFENRLYMLGGWNNTKKDIYGPAATTNEVWLSADGKKWERILDAAPWAPRHTFGCVVYKDMIWVVGGDSNSGVCNCDIWKSPDGISWEHITDAPPWAPRVLHQALVFNGKIWVIGGQSPSMMVPGEPDVFYGDVWNTADGLNWTRVCEYAPWFGRGMIGNNAVKDGRMWVLGGGTYETPTKPYRHYYTDVWSSENGVDWELAAADAGWPVRAYHDVAAFDGKLWVLEGFGGNEYGSRSVPMAYMLNRYANRNDVWYSEDGKTWTELPRTPWAPRHASSVCVHDNALWVVSGNNFDADVWKLVSDNR